MPDSKISALTKYNPQQDDGMSYIPIAPSNTPTSDVNNKVLLSEITNVPSSRIKVFKDNSAYWNGHIVTKTEDGWIYMYYMDAPSHTVFGPAYLTRSRDGINWEEGWLINFTGTTDEIGSIALGSIGNRILMTYQHMVAGVPDYVTARFAYSDDGGQTFTPTTTFPVASLPVGDMVELFAYGEIVKIYGDTFYAPYYGNWSVDPNYSFYFKTTDAGLTWSWGNVIMSADPDGIFPTGGGINETWITVVEEGSSVATTKLLALVRSEKYYTFHFQWYSNDGGTTWNSIAVEQGKWFTEANALDPLGGPDVGSNTYPVSMIKKDGWIYVVYGHRGVNGVDNGDHQLRVIKGKAIDAYNNPDNWSQPNKLYFALSPKAFPNDFGYTQPFEVNGQLMCVFYDISPYYLSGSSVSSTKSRQLIFPLEHLYWFESYNVADETIANDTETTLSLPWTRVDSDRALDETTGVIKVPEDGWYVLQAGVQIEPSAGGTYRELTLLQIDHGDEDGPAPSVMNGRFPLARKAIAPSTVAQLNRIEIFAQSYLYKDMELRVNFKHDAGTDLDILNTDRELRAFLRFKKID
jgi:hypothetical protein